MGKYRTMIKLCPRCNKRITLVSYEATALYKIQKNGRLKLIDTDPQDGEGLGDYICQKCSWRSSDNNDEGDEE